MDYKATGTLQRSLDSLGRLSRNEYEALLDAMVRAGLIEIEEAEFEKDGEAIRFRKVRLTDAGMEVRRTTPLALLISDGIVDAFEARADGGPGGEKDQGRGEEGGGGAGELCRRRVRLWRRGCGSGGRRRRNGCGFRRMWCCTIGR